MLCHFRSLTSSVVNCPAPSGAFFWVIAPTPERQEEARPSKHLLSTPVEIDAYTSAAAGFADRLAPPHRLVS
jgi:hypothetical protein